MMNAGLILFGIGIGAYGLTFVAQAMQKYFGRSDTLDENVSTFDRIQIARQRSLMRQVPVWRWFGVVAMATGVVLGVVSRM